ncbi:hypothetical protein IWW45_003918 [Coemansia sp. RSA 485]|nr:hypothetical protein IWW45_003918 [Coemansia sp. RSA 485]
MAMGLLGGGGNSKPGNSSGGAGGLGPLLGMATAFLGGGGGGAPAAKKSSGGGDFFSKILGNVFGNRARDLDSGSMDGLDTQQAQLYYSEIYQSHNGLARFTEEQLGAAAAVQAIGEMQRNGELEYVQGEEASQKLLGAVMGEAVGLHKRHVSEGGNADKEDTATAAVRTALKIIDDAAAGNSSGGYQQQQQHGQYQQQGQYGGYGNQQPGYGGESSNYYNY